ncbi:GNAT family N-acetyltransferase [Anaeromicrobium sediminis]|uniref:GNAT family N-acetyltransferase n=1 Tax=Anaeromicrobium sediminis TaxID=1478221 RepID=A0A267MLF3_9FIRM|nr:GNAT family N-acetyltransferase [Anaeromicrobium sediminis]PAB60366.1 GNAT family N-acetyltransferase [Anaeromicrobium sediminis]
MEFRKLLKEENIRLSEIDRSEVVERICLHKDGQLIIKEEFYHIKGWHEKELQDYIEILHDISDRGGTIYGAFEGAEICGIAALDSQFFGINNEYLKFDKLYVSKNYRGKGIGTELVKLVRKKALEMGAKKLYISATPFENTVRFYMGVGCTLAEEFIKEMHDLEPEDIHLELKL